MTQPAADARKRIQSLLVRIIEHEVKMRVAEPIDAKYRTAFQASRSHWQQEIEAWWREIKRMNQTSTRRHGQFFSDENISQWKEELIESGLKSAVNRLMKDLRKQGVEGDARWLKQIAEELYD